MATNPTPTGWDHTVLAAIGGAVVAMLGTVLTYRIRMRKTDLDYWQALQAAQKTFQDEIHEELNRTKTERNELREEIDQLKKQVNSLISQNEKLMMEKLEWMQKATALQMLLQKAMQSFPFNSNEPLLKWFNEEIDKIQEESKEPE